jgi:DNA polymerase-3 subunit alpha
MAKERAKFVAGAKKLHNLDERTSDAIFDILNKFAGYGFNKSHSAAYAILSYQTGYLKANHPVQFMAAMLSSELGNADKASHFIAECESMGLKVLGPDVNESGADFTPVVRPGEPSIRFGLAGIKGVGDQAAQRILAEREAGGPYQDFRDFLLRVDARAINKRVLENLVATGAFDFSGAAREELFSRIDDAIGALGELHRKYPSLRRDAPGAAPAQPAETMLFDLASSTSPAPERAALAVEFAELLRHRRKAPSANGNGSHAAALRRDDFLDISGASEAAPGAAKQKGASAPAAERVLTAANRLLFEKELLGFYVSGHPLNVYEGLIDAIDTCSAHELVRQSDRTEFRLCGIAGGIAKKFSKKDNRPWIAFTLATKRAGVALNLFADAFAAYGSGVAENALIVVLGNVIAGNDGARINAKECYPLEAAVAGLVRKITWLLRPEHPEAPAFIRHLRETVVRQAGDTRMEFGFVFEDRVASCAEASPALSWKVNPATFQELRAHPAVAGVQIETKKLELKPDRRWGKKG